MSAGWPALAVLLCLLVACQRPAPAPEPAPAPAPSRLDSWMGRWNGPEGTFLSIAKRGDGYAIEVADLDGPKSYLARAAGDHLEFERGGATESIRPTDGRGTGMKWLAEKADCLVIRPGEGFCRD